MKFAYCVTPHIGGTYTVFRHLRQGLAPHGIDVRWLGVGTSVADMPDSEFGESIDAALPEEEQAETMIQILNAGGYDGVFINVLTARMQMNIARYLPRHLLRVMIVHNITPGTYVAAQAIRDHVHATVGVSKRCRTDLINLYHFLPKRTLTIENAVDARGMRGIERMASNRPGLRMVFLGRVEDASKGVMLLPALLDELPRDFTLTIAGDGPDLPRLKTRLARFADRVTYLGFVAPERISTVLLNHDALIMPSRFEGFGLTLVEAMAAGCVPVATMLSGVTDTIVTHGQTGFLFPLGDMRRAALIMAALTEQTVRTRMSNAARAVVLKDFTIERMGQRYAELIHTIKANPPAIAPVLPVSEWSIPRGLRAGLRTYLPVPVKNWVRGWRERHSA